MGEWTKTPWAAAFDCLRDSLKRERERDKEAEVPSETENCMINKQ